MVRFFFLRLPSTLCLIVGDVCLYPLHPSNLTATHNCVATDAAATGGARPRTRSCALSASVFFLRVFPPCLNHSSAPQRIKMQILLRTTMALGSTQLAVLVLYQYSRSTSTSTSTSAVPATGYSTSSTAAALPGSTTCNVQAAVAAASSTAVVQY
jgi:hypothetical protein